MAKMPPVPGTTGRRDWKTAVDAIKKLLANGDDFRAAVKAMSARWRDLQLDAVVGIESRGFILGAAMAHELGIGFVPVRKPGKLPGKVLREEYTLEYRSDCIEVHADALPARSRTRTHFAFVTLGRCP